MRFRGHVLIFWSCSHRISKAQVNDYSEKIEAIASKLVTPLVRDFFFNIIWIVKILVGFITFPLFPLCLVDQLPHFYIFN